MQSFLTKLGTFPIHDLIHVWQKFSLRVVSFEAITFTKMTGILDSIEKDRIVECTRC